MQYGKIAGVPNPISRLVQGSVMVESKAIPECFYLLDAIRDLGCTTFDTAHVYGSGDNERTFGKWVRERGIRNKINIIGKGAHHSQDRKRVTPWDISADIYDSLARFQTDHIDIYLLHRDDPAVPVGPIVETLNGHLKAGRILAYGGSNWSHTRVQEANDYAASHGLAPFVASSPNFSLAMQVQPPWDGCITISGPAQQTPRDYYAKLNMPLFTWSSLAGGFFSGRLRRDNLATFETYLDKLAVTSYAHEDNFKRLDRVQQLAEEKNMSIPQIATAYVMSYPLNIFALVGCQTADEFKATAAASELRLSQNEMEWLDLKRPSR